MYNQSVRGCRTFADAMNNLRFELSVPEYYETNIPEYFRKAIQPPKPIVNGVEVEWDEYLETHPDEKPITFIPNPIYRNEDMNRAFANKTPSEIIDLIINNVPFEFMRVDDIGIVIDIFDGYYNEVKEYILFNTRLKMFTDDMASARIRLSEVYNASLNYRENIKPNTNRGPISLIDILNRMKRG